MTVFDRIMEFVDEEGKVLSEEDLEMCEEEPKQIAHIQYLLRMGLVGEEMSNILYVV